MIHPVASRNASALRVSSQQRQSAVRSRTASVSTRVIPEPKELLNSTEMYWFNYFKFDIPQFKARVQNDIALLKKQRNAKTKFNHQDYQDYYVPKFTSTTPSSKLLRDEFKTHLYPTSNPFIEAFIQSSSKANDAYSEFYNINVTPEEVRFHLWEDLIRRVVLRLTSPISK
jgi:hypothetical protein